MKKILWIVIAIALLSCSNSIDVAEKSESSAEQNSTSTNINQEDINSRDLGRNSIRKQTETHFRSLKPEDSAGHKSVTSDTAE
ncbi:MAG: hypothetical protein ABFR82_15715 [Nitrospirota bacterium]